MKAYVRTEGVNVHGKPNGAIVDQFKRGDKLRIIGDARHTDTVVWYPVELLNDQRKSCGWVEGKALNFEKDVPKPLPPAPPKPPDDDWLEDDYPPAPMLHTSQLTFWIVFAVIAVGSIFLLTSPWWR